MNAVLLVGSGPMAIEYAKVLKALSADIIVVGRGNESAARFQEATGLSVHTGGIETWLEQNKNFPPHVIVSVGERWLGKIALTLIEYGARSLLVEKPGGHTSEEVKAIATETSKRGIKAYVAYNRRFYASVKKAQEIIREDGGVTSYNFEFTEWSHVIKDLQKEPGVKEYWFLHNSTHVIDLAFYLGGKPRDFSCFTAGGLEWHPAASIFAGAGISESGALFSYQANWEAPGRWGVEILTKKHRLIFKPMEKLQIQKIGSVAIEFVDIDDQLDTNYKPGLFKQVNAYMNDDAQCLCTIEEQAGIVDLYNKIANYARNR